MKNNWATIGTRITKARQKKKKKKKIGCKKKPCHDQTKKQNILSTKNLTKNKLNTPYIGTFKIINVQNTTIELFLPNIRKIPKFHASLIKKTSSNTPLTTTWNYSTKKIRNKTNITKKTKGTKGRIFGKMEELRYFKSNMGTENSFDKRPNNFQTIPKNYIKGKMLRFQF